MPRGRLPTRKVATTSSLAPSITVISSDRSLLTNTRYFGDSAQTKTVPARSRIADTTQWQNLMSQLNRAGLSGQIERWTLDVGRWTFLHDSARQAFHSRSS